MKNRIIKPCIIGLGYVGLPLFLKLHKKINTIGYDSNYLRIKGIPHIIYIKNGELNQSMVGFDSIKLGKFFEYINKQIQLCI